MNIIQAIKNGITSFIGLSDAPSSYEGKANSFLKVNSLATGLEFFSESINYLTPNSPIVAGSNTKLYYDEKGLIVSGTPAILSSSDFGEQGTIHTILHGNQAGAPYWDSISEQDILLNNNTINNVSTSMHGFAPTLSNVDTQFLNGQGAWVTPSGIANAYLSQSINSQTSGVVNHNFGAYPIVQAINSSGEVIAPQSIINTSVNSFTVTFATPTTGNILATLGSPQLNNYISTSNNYTTTVNDYIINQSGSGKSVTLITAIGRAGKIFIIKNSSLGAITINTSGSEKIDGLSSITLSTLDSITVYSDGTNYYII